MKLKNNKIFSITYSQSKQSSFATRVSNVVHMTISSCAYASPYTFVHPNASKITNNMLKSVKR